MKRLHLIWSCPLSDTNRITATNAYAFGKLNYFLPVITCKLQYLQSMDRDIRKLLTENGARHPNASIPSLHLDKKLGGRGIKSVEQEYKLAKIKTMLHITYAKDNHMQYVRQHEHNKKVHRSIVKDAEKYAQEFGIALHLADEADGYSLCYETETKAYAAVGKSANVVLKTAVNNNLQQQIAQQPWQGNIMKDAWISESLDPSSLAWLSRWKTCPSPTVAAIEEIRQQILPTRMYYSAKLQQQQPTTKCRFCGKKDETVYHVLSNCDALSPSDYVARHNAGLKCLFFALLKKHNLIDRTPAWYSPGKPSPVYENQTIKLTWDIPIFTEGVIQHNRPDVVLWDKEKRKIVILEMTVVWFSTIQEKKAIKDQKYASLRAELKRQYSDHDISQISVVFDILGGHDRDLKQQLRTLVKPMNVERVMSNMQKAIAVGTTRIAQKLKYLTK